jgi:hypothetical protein
MHRRAAAVAAVAVALLAFPSSSVAQQPHTVTISVVGQVTATLPGRVLTGAGAESCPPTCSYSLPTGARLALRAFENPGAAFRGWQDITLCAEYPYVDDVCTVTVGDTDLSVAAVFVQGRGSLSVNATGDVAITSSPPGIACAGGPQPQATCAANFPLGTKVHLTATPTSPGVSVTRWSSWECAPRAATCDVKIDGVRSVTAFVAPFILTIKKQGDLANTIVYTRTGTTCGPGCSSFRMRLSSAHDVSIQVVNPSATFTGWGPPCEHPSPDLCTFFATESETLVAAFCSPSPFAWTCLPQTPYALEFKPVVVYRSGRGSVQIGWNGKRTTCTKTRCKYLVPIATTVTFTAQPLSRFSQWNAPFCTNRSAVCKMKSDFVDSIRGVFVR